jgi:hypothetical protein
MCAPAHAMADRSNQASRLLVLRLAARKGMRTVIQPIAVQLCRSLDCNADQSTNHAAGREARSKLRLSSRSGSGVQEEG